MLYRLLLLSAFGFLFLSCSGQEPRWPIQTQSGSFIKESATRNKKLYEEERNFIKDFIDKDTTHAYYASEKGFWYYYNVQDTTDSKTPEFGDGVRFSYDIRDFSDKTIISEEENGMQRYKVDQSNQDLISGIREGIKLMKEGEEVTFLFPSYKAYGYYGVESKLGTNIPVKSTVKLYAIKSKEE